MRRPSLRYSASAQYCANCTAHACLPNSQPLEAGRGCGWDTFLFNVTADPTETTNLAGRGDYAKQLRALESRVRELYEVTPRRRRRRPARGV